MSNWLMPTPEKRNHKRLDVHLGVDLLIEGKKMSATTSNISCGGLFLPIQKHILKERTDIELIVTLPSKSRQVTLVGEVARFQDGSLIKKRRRGVAIRFRGLYNDEILAIDKLIKSKPH